MEELLPADAGALDLSLLVLACMVLLGYAGRKATGVSGKRAAAIFSRPSWLVFSLASFFLGHVLSSYASMYDDPVAVLQKKKDRINSLMKNVEKDAPAFSLYAHTVAPYSHIAAGDLTEDDRAVINTRIDKVSNLLWAGAMVMNQERDRVSRAGLMMGLKMLFEKDARSKTHLGARIVSWLFFLFALAGSWVCGSIQYTRGTISMHGTSAALPV